jgi:MoaA/NifB/PqqE/SkfB family radical SAM enzyme
MNGYGIRFLGHNIPRVLPVHFSSVFAFRIQNTLSRGLYFQSHSSFYGTAINDTTLRISILLDGDFLADVLVYNDCIHSRERATLFFPFQTQDEGEYRLQIVIAEQHARDVSEGSRSLFGMALQVKRNFSGFNLKQKVRHGFFTFLYSESPIQWKRLQVRSCRAILSYFRQKSAFEEKILMQLKEINRELAFMEKQVRKLQVASLPCYLGMDTTTKCNLNCIFCFRNYVDTDFNSKPDMSADTLNQLIKELFPTALTLNLSTIGEPLISARVEKILKACSDYQVRLSLTTNGTLLKGDDFLRKLASVLHYIEISFDSASPELFEKLRSGASYESILQNAIRFGEIRRSLPDPKFNLGFSMTLFRENLKEIPDVLRIVSEVGGNFLKTDIGVIFSKRDVHRSVLTCPGLYNEIYEIAHEKSRQIGIRLLMRPPFSENCHSKAVRYGICDYLYLSACIRSEGELNPCYFHLIASLSVKNEFRTAWNSEIMQRLRLEHDTNRCHPFCKDCYLVLEGSDSVENRKKQFLKGDALK